MDTEPHPGGIGFANIIDRVAESATLATFGGEGTTTPWHPKIRRIPIVTPTPAYPVALLWRHTATDNPQLTTLLDFITNSYDSSAATTLWMPEPDRALFTRDCRVQASA